MNRTFFVGKKERYNFLKFEISWFAFMASFWGFIWRFALRMWFRIQSDFPPKTSSLRTRSYEVTYKIGPKKMKEINKLWDLLPFILNAKLLFCYFNNIFSISEAFFLNYFSRSFWATFIVKAKAVLFSIKYRWIGKEFWAKLSGSRKSHQTVWKQTDCRPRFARGFYRKKEIVNTNR